MFELKSEFNEFSTFGINVISHIVKKDMQLLINKSSLVWCFEKFMLGTEGIKCY